MRLDNKNMMLPQRNWFMRFDSSRLNSSDNDGVIDNATADTVPFACT